MPLIDMPLNELKTYMGTNPCPEDIDDYWDAALAEMEAVDPQVELIPSQFQVPYADCFDLYFTGVKGARIHAKYLRPKNISGKHPAVLQFHGYSGHSGDWNDKLQYIALGYSVAAMDCRGQGGKSQDVGGVVGNTLNGHIIRGLDGEKEDLLYRSIYLDTAQLAKIVMAMPEVDPSRVGAMGASQGGALTVACACLVPSLKKAVPIYPFLSDYRRIWEMDLAKDAYAELRDYFRNFDPTHAREDEIFMRLGYIDLKNMAKRIRADILMATGLMDTICPPSTQFAIYNRIASQKDMVLFPDFGHEWLPGFGDQAMAYLMDL